MSEDKILTMPAAKLARAAPREWDEFKTAFRLYAAEKRDELEKSLLEDLQKSQGRAQACSRLSTLFDDAVKAADRISDRAGK